MPDEFYDDETIPLAAILSGPGAVKVHSVDFRARIDRAGRIEHVDKTGVAVDGFPRTATWQFTPPAVPVELAYYDLSYEVSAQGAAAKPARQLIRVWPRQVELEFSATDHVSHAKLPFGLVRQGATSKHKTNETGTWIGRFMGEFTVTVEPPFSLRDVTDTGPSSHRRKFTVTRAGLVARFVSPDPQGLPPQIKQYVNLGVHRRWTKDFPFGSEIEFEVGTVDDVGRRGETLYIECLFGRETGRTTPKPQLLADRLAAPPTTSNGDKTHKGSVTLGAEGRATFRVSLGLAGGETCVVKIGATSACSDATLSFVNWRRIDYQSWMPLATGSSRLSDFAFLRGSQDARLPDVMTNYMDATLGAAFVEFRPVEGSVGFFGRDGIAGIEHGVLASDLFTPGDPGKRVLVLTEDMLDRVRERAVGPVGQRVKTQMSLVWTDFLAHGEIWTQSFGGLAGPAQDLACTRSVFEHAIDDHPQQAQRGAHSGNRWKGGELALTQLRWRVTGVWNDAMSSYDPPPPGGSSDWQVLDKRDAIAGMLDFVEHRKLRVKALLPGGLGGKIDVHQGWYRELATGAYVQLEIELKGLAYGIGAYASALRGDVTMTLQYGTFPERALASTILHEAGHNMGMAYINRTRTREEKARGTDATITDDDVAFGRLDTSEIPGIAFPLSWIDGGYTYVGRGHTGPHCARGVTNTGPAQPPTLAGDMGTRAEREFTCIMYGGGDMQVDRQYSFCVDCTRYIRGEDLRDIRKNWWP